jgi:chemotaxis protein CheD
MSLNAKVQLSSKETDQGQIKVHGRTTFEVGKCEPPHTSKDLCYSFNRRFKKKYMNVVAGEYFVCDEDIIMGTVLGSCISVCLYSDASSFCGMNHFMLPEKGAKYRNENDIMHTDSAFYGINAMEMLINTLLKCGIKKNHLKAKVFGGGEVLSVRSGEKTVGKQNTEFVLLFLEMERIPVVSYSVGGNFARKILFFTKTHEVFQWHLGKKVEEQIEAEERKLRYDTLKKEEISFFK